VNDRSRLPSPALSIGAVERDTGLSKDTLRVWERRYGFPLPGRDEFGERVYTPDQVEKLRLVKRLLDGGHRPGRVVPMTMAELVALAESSDGQPMPAPEAAAPGAAAAMSADDVRLALEIVRRHDAFALRAELTRQLLRHGLARFVTSVLAPLNAAVGEAWMRGQLEIFEEHLYTEAVQAVLRQAIAGMPEPVPGARPRVLLTTLPGEPHGLGILMAEALFVLDGCVCLSLGTQTPLWDVALAAAAQRADIVALSFTGCMSPNQVVDGLAELREKLPAPVRLWAGGSAPVLHRRRLPGVEPMATLATLPAELQRWREQAQPPAR
jgi:DNA-binding transcriptional MerR regulator/methylmalonyl-CoA mutase cobalamin-binding subunit